MKEAFQSIKGPKAIAISQQKPPVSLWSRALVTGTLMLAMLSSCDHEPAYGKEAAKKNSNDKAQTAQVAQKVNGNGQEEKKYEVVRATVTWYYKSDGKYYQISAETSDKLETITTYVDGEISKVIHIDDGINKEFNGKFENRKILMSNKPTIFAYGISGDKHNCYYFISEFISDKTKAFIGKCAYNTDELKKYELKYLVNFDENKREYVITIQNDSPVDITRIDENGKMTAHEDYGLYKLMTMR